MTRITFFVSLLLVTLIQSPGFSQAGVEACLVDPPVLEPPTEVFSDQISVPLIIEGKSVAFDGGLIELAADDDVTGVWVARGSGALFFENGRVDVTHQGSGGRIKGIAIDRDSGAYFSNGTVSVSSEGGSFIDGVSIDGDFVLDGGTIEVTAGSDVFLPRGIDSDRGAMTIINGGTIRVDGGEDAIATIGVSVRGHPFHADQASTVVIRGGAIEVTGRRAIGIEVRDNATACIFGGSVTADTTALDLDSTAKAFIFGSGFNYPVNTPITDSEGTITGTLHDGNEVSWSFERRIRRDDPIIMLVSNPFGDFNDNLVLDSDDLDLLARQQNAEDADLTYDLTQDGIVDVADRDSWLNIYRRTWFGDFDLDDYFDTRDLINVFASGKYQSGEVALFSEGDADGDHRFTSDDLTRIFAGGGYETQMTYPVEEAANRAVPEPTGILLVTAVLFMIVVGRRVR